MKIRGIGLSDVGRKRQNNEDALLVEDDLGLFVVCDGLGGHASGERAAKLCVELVRGSVASSRETLRAVRADPAGEHHDALRKIAGDAVQLACKGVHEAATSDPALSGMGCTVTLLLVAGTNAVMAHVGDTRLYLCRDGAAWQLSTDHTVAGEMVRRGHLTPDAATTHPYSSALSRAIGGQESVQVETLILDVLPDDVFLLCSDGLTQHLEGLAELAAILNDESPEDAPRILVDLANARGGNDNVTALLVVASAPDEEQQEASALAGEVRARLDALRRVDIFGDLRFAELLRVNRLVELHECAAGEVLLAAGRDESRLCIVLDDGFELLDSDGRASPLRAGDAIGRTSLLVDRPCRATLRARTASRALSLRGESFRQLAKRRPFLGVTLLSELARRLEAELVSTGDRIVERLPREDRAWWNPMSWF